MNRKDSPQSVIDSYRRRQQMAPYFMAGLAVLLVIVGIVILVMWFTSSGKGKVASVSLFASPTPTTTNTATPTPVTPTATATNTVTVTVTPTVTMTLTPSGPVEYTVQDGDTCWDIAVKAKVDLNVLLALNNFGTSCPIKPGGKIFIPQPGASLPTGTAVPTGASGAKIEYTVQSGDTLAVIADKFNTTVDAIMTDNKLKDANKINMGDKLTIKANTITVTPTKAATATITPGGPTLTATTAPTATATKKP
jgi:LysM repeat protein